MGEDLRGHPACGVHAGVILGVMDADAFSGQAGFVHRDGPFADLPDSPGTALVPAPLAGIMAAKPGEIMQSDNPTAAILLIGDEILSGRTRDLNAHHLAGILNGIGIDLREIRVVADDHQAIVAALRALDQALGGAWDMVFTSGGIGPTHDDITADAVADAYGTVLGINADARRMMEERWTKLGMEITEARLRMARIPVGATLIENAESAAPGFSIGGAHVMAGVPSVFRSMVEALVPRLNPGRPPVSETIRVDRPESDVADDLTRVADAYPALSLGSYPFSGSQGLGTNLVVRGLDGDEVARATADLRRALGMPA